MINKIILNLVCRFIRNNMSHKNWDSMTAIFTAINDGVELHYKDNPYNQFSWLVEQLTIAKESFQYDKLDKNEICRSAQYGAQNGYHIIKMILKDRRDRTCLPNCPQCGV